MTGFSKIDWLAGKVYDEVLYLIGEMLMVEIKICSLEKASMITLSTLESQPKGFN